MDSLRRDSNLPRHIIDLIDLTKDSPLTMSNVTRQKYLRSVPETRRRAGRPGFRDIVSRALARQPDDAEAYTMAVLRETIAHCVPTHSETIEIDNSGSSNENSRKEDQTYFTVDADTGEPTSLMCPICFESLCAKIKPTAPKCGHVFCAACLKASVRDFKKCPTCKAPVKTLQSCIRLYF